MQHYLLLSVDSFFHDNHNLLITLFIGAVAGLIAQLITPGRGFNLIITIIIGIAGGWLGGLLFKSYLNFTDSPLINAIICATAGALILCIAINLILGPKRKDDVDIDRSDYESGR